MKKNTKPKVSHNGQVVPIKEQQHEIKATTIRAVFNKTAWTTTLKLEILAKILQSSHLTFLPQAPIFGPDQEEQNLMSHSGVTLVLALCSLLTLLSGILSAALSANSKEPL